MRTSGLGTVGPEHNLLVRFSILAAALGSFVVSGQLHAQELDRAETTTTEEAAPKEDSIGFDSGSFIAVPVPINDPTFGTGLVLGAGYLFKTDEGSNTSFIGGGVVGTNEESYAGGLGASLSLDNNRYSGFFFLGAADVNYDLFVLGQPLRVEQQGAAFQGEFRYGFSEAWSGGISMRYLESQLAGLNNSPLPPLLANVAENSIATLGLVAQRDTRDDSFYPTTGSKLDFSLTYSKDVSGADISYTHATLGYDQFWSLTDNSVVGMRAAACKIGGRAPFFDTCLLGAELRGFSLFEYFGDSMLTAQAEYRHRFTKRFGYVAFAGLGDVRKSDISIDSGLRYAGGLGLRYRVSKKFPLDVSLDVTLNDDEESYVYFSVGQAF